MAPQSCLWKTKLLFTLMSWYTVICLVTLVSFKTKADLKVHWSTKLINVAVNRATSQSELGAKPWDLLVLRLIGREGQRVSLIGRLPWAKVVLSLRFVNCLYSYWLWPIHNSVISNHNPLLLGTGKACCHAGMAVSNSSTRLVEPRLFWPSTSWTFFAEHFLSFNSYFLVKCLRLLWLFENGIIKYNLSSQKSFECVR